MNITGPLCIGAVKNNFFWGIFNNTYTSTDVKTVDEGIVTGGEQTVFTTGYAYPIKLPLKTVISLGLSAKGFIDIQGLSENQPAKGLIALSKLNFRRHPPPVLLQGSKRRGNAARGRTECGAFH